MAGIAGRTSRGCLLLQGLPFYSGKTAKPLMKIKGTISIPVQIELDYIASCQYNIFKQHFAIVPAAAFPTRIERKAKASQERQMNTMPPLENLAGFWNRVGSFIFDSLPHAGCLETNPGLEQKVDDAGSFRPFAGSTTVFTLPEECLDRLETIQSLLYDRCGDVLARRLEKSSFHITLHDLVSGAPSPELEGRIRAIREQAMAAVRSIAESGETVRLHSTRLFNMVNTSMVLGFAPADEESCRRLMAYYEALQGVLHLGYPLTPHVTLGYFRPGMIGEDALSRLRRVVDLVGERECFSVELPVSRLEYQHFSDMGRYWRGDLG